MASISQPTMMSLAELLDRYDPVYPGKEPTWADTFHFLMNDTYEAPVVEELMRQYQEQGCFREPIRVSTWELLESYEDDADDDDDDAEAEYEPMRLAVEDGTHRVCALYLLGAETALVRHHHPQDDEEANEQEDDVYFVTEVLISPHVPAQPDISVSGGQTNVSDEDDQFDHFFNACRSISINDDVWLTSSVMCGNAAQFSVAWDNTVDSLGGEAFAKVIDEAVSKIVHKRFPEAVVHTVIEQY